VHQKRLLITGANKSIGFEMARQLTKNGFRVYLAGRDRQKGKNAIDIFNIFEQPADSYSISKR
jgi:short-subunit dehydrogenase